MQDILWFDEISHRDIKDVGGKGANLGELVKAGLPVPRGFVVASAAYFDFIRLFKIDVLIKKELTKLNPENTKALNRAAAKIQAIILEKKLPAVLASEIENNYLKLIDNEHLAMAIRSSATAEDLPNFSFAGEQASFLNVAGAANVVLAVKKAWASLFSPRAIYYRAVNKFNHLKVGIAVIVQQMVASQKAGVLFTINPVNRRQDEMVIEAALGLGEVVVAGQVTPDRFVLAKDNLKVKWQEIHPQEWLLASKDDKNRHLRVPENKRDKPKLLPLEIKNLARLGKKIERYYKKPQDTEWAIDEKGKIFFVQSRPVTTPKRTVPVETEIKNTAQNELIVRGIAASLGVSFGVVRLVSRVSEIAEVKEGEVLVAEMTNPSFVPAMKRAAAIVTDTGGLTSHAAIVAREMGIPAVVGTGRATHILKDGQMVTVDGTNGLVYKGKAALTKKTSVASAEEIKTATKIYLNLAEPELAEKHAGLPVDGVGLLRAEFMLAGLGEHPQYLIENKQDSRLVSHLADGIETIARAFAPRPVVYRATDFKTNEYRGLKGGEKYEPKEENPTLGMRGAARYLKNPKMFNLELEALLLVRNKYDLKNVYLSIPFVRTVEEWEKVKKMIIAKGLRSSKTFRLWLVLEVPANFLMIEEFCQAGLDGISFGSNDLTQLILGVDRDNPALKEEFNERDEAVLRAMEQVISKTKKYGITSSICGQAPSVYPEVVERLVKAGITSLSINPDAVDWVRKLVASVEKKMDL